MKSSVIRTEIQMFTLVCSLKVHRKFVAMYLLLNRSTIEKKNDSSDYYASLDQKS